MTCLSCQKRRDAIFQAWQERRIAEAVRELAKGAAEIVGLKDRGDVDRN